MPFDMNLPYNKQNILIHIRFDRGTIEVRFVDKGLAQPWQTLLVQHMCRAALAEVGWEFWFYDDNNEIQRIRKTPNAGT